MHILSLMVTVLSGADCPYLLFWDLDMDFAPLPLLIDILEVLQEASNWLACCQPPAPLWREVCGEGASYRDEAGLREKHSYRVA